MDDLEDAKRRYHFALAPEDYDRLPFYRHLLHALEGDELAIELLASVRAEQRNPMLVLAALHLAALRGHVVLGPIYEAARHGELSDPEGAAATVLKTLRDAPRLVRDELGRSTQTNEPGRCAVLQPLVRELAEGARSINVVEIGASAGINLWFDQFEVRAHDDGPALSLVCEDLTPVDRASALPRVDSRVGVDPYPLELDDVDDRLWLKACIWPEERRRQDRFDAVVEAHDAWPTLTKLTGTALERLDDAFMIGDRQRTIVYNSWVAFYFSPDERRDYYRAIARRCREGDVAWISMESTTVRWPGVAFDEAASHRGASQIVVAEPGGEPRLWGWCHAHGRWLERGPAAPAESVAEGDFHA